MKKYYIDLIISALFLIQFSCVAQRYSRDVEPYYEDLSHARPLFGMKPGMQTKNDVLTKNLTYTPTPMDVKKQLDVILDSIDRLNQLKKTIDGYTIQVYSGQSRQEAITVKSQIIMALNRRDRNNEETHLQYVQPNFRVTMGKYVSRLEAQKDIFWVKEFFLNAILVPQKIRIQQH